MELTEKNGQASMEEILASIRRIIAEEPGGTGQVIDLNAPRQNRGDGLLDDPSDFDLPSMFRAQSPAAPERPTPLFGRLSEAIRAASSGGGQGGDGFRGESRDLGLSTLRLHRADPSEPEDARANGASFLLTTFHEATSLRADDPTSPANPQPATPTNGFDMSASPSRAADPHQPETPTVQPSPEVPRQMVAFKDTRFRGMGSAPAGVEPVAPYVSPFETAATTALLNGANHAPAASVEAAPAAEPAYNGNYFNGNYPAFEAPEPVFEPAPAVAQPAPPPVPQVAVADAAAQGSPIEDATADLLRPMLRQWLADNMPRMVEKALHIEVAESVKSLKK